GPRGAIGENFAGGRWFRSGSACSVSILSKSHMKSFLLPLLILMGTLALPAADSPGNRPNFIFILADDLGWSDLGCYGHAQIKTPNLDRLASEGTLFTQFYVNASVCSPSRCAFMTGQYPARHKIHGHYAEHTANAARGMNDWL